MKILISIVIATLFSICSLSKADEGVHSLGVMGGETILTSDWGSPWGNALGAGVVYRYAASDWLELEIGYLNSKHSGSANGSGITLTQNAFNVDMLYDFDVLDIFTPYVKGGVEYVLHNQDVPGAYTNLTNQSYNGFGLNLGFGGDFSFSKNFAAGLEFVFHDIFNVQTSAVPGTGPTTVMGNYFTVMAHFLFRFGSTSGASSTPGKTF